jgi:hypothetical protein
MTRLILSIVVVVAAALLSVDAKVVSTTDARLPSSFSKVISDLESEGCAELATACLITSRSVTKEQRAKMLQTLVEAGEDELDAKVTAVGTSSGLALAQPKDVAEVVATSCACGGTIVYQADPIDLSRGDGLFDTLAPAMEQLLSQQQQQATLVVLVQDGDVANTKARLEQAAESIVSKLIHTKSASVLQDVFDKVEYVTSPAQAVSIVRESSTTSPAEATLLVSESINRGSATPTTSLSAGDLAAARILGPAGRRELEAAVDIVRNACQSDDGSALLIPTFGSLCDAAVKQALDNWEAAASSSSSILSSAFGKQIRSNLLSELQEALGDMFQEQLDLLQTASFDGFRKSLSKLLVSPNLGSDMESEAGKAVAAFSKAAGKLASRQAATGQQIAASKQRFRKQLKDFCSDRLLTAQAGGQYKPLPRKGVTVGMHWLLPKPFGNDYRQEPWMVHATDSMVYIPEGKVTNVSPDEVAAGDWREKIVPSPVGNDMIYMQ